jgi:hypothetical protein
MFSYLFHWLNCDNCSKSYNERAQSLDSASILRVLPRGELQLNCNASICSSDWKNDRIWLQSYLTALSMEISSGIFIHLLDLTRSSCEQCNYTPIELTSQILPVSSWCSLTISVRVQQPDTAQKLTILINTKLLLSFTKFAFFIKSERMLWGKLVIKCPRKPREVFSL